MTRIITRFFDSTNIGDIPADAEMIAVYADGKYSGTEAAARARFPKALLLTITVEGQPNREVCDCETGLLTPAQAAAWAHAETAAGRLPSIYCNASTWPSVKTEVAKLGLDMGERYWIAEYDGDPTIPAGASAKQYLGSPGDSPGHYDESSVVAYWEGVDPKPKPRKPLPFLPNTRKVITTAEHAVTKVTRLLAKRNASGPGLTPPGKTRLRNLDTALLACSREINKLLALP